MLYPQLEQTARSREYTQAWKGYNHNLRAGDGEFWDMKNMTGDLYPVLAPRKRRGKCVQAGGFIRGMYVKSGRLIHVVGNEAYVNGDPVGIGVSGGPEEPCQIVGMGAYAAFFPGGEYFDLQAYIAGDDNFDRGKIENRTELHCGAQNPETGEVTIVWFELCMEDGTVYEEMTYREPEEPTDGLLWIDTTGETPMARIYDGERAVWVIVTQMYVKMVGPGIGAGFSKGDGVIISGALPGDATGEQKKVVNGTHTLTDVGKDYLVIPGLLVARRRQVEGTITVSRSFPRMDYVVEQQNRLWGCKYGKVYDEDGKATYVNEIYACALGDFKNWNKYEGLSTDSYTASRGSDGPWTGAIVYQGHPTFFKEDCIETVYPSATGGHQITTTNCQGLQASSPGNSLAIVGGILYWYTGREVVAYDGSYPTGVSAALGQEVYDASVAGALGSKYYLCLKQGEKSRLFVYDTATGLWHKEDGASVLRFAGDTRWLFFATRENEIWDVTGDGPAPEEQLGWFVETGEMGLATPGRKYISRLNLRLLPQKGAWADVYIQYDSDGQWEHKGHIEGKGYLVSKLLPVAPRRCDHFKLKIEGSGDVKIYSMSKIYEEGSDLF